VDRLMRTRMALRTRLEDLFGVHVGRARHGQRDGADLRRSGCAIERIFDVGANVGQSALKFRADFPRAEIHCFEPVHETFEILRRTVSGLRGVHCHELACGSADGEQTIYLTHQSNTSSLLRPADVVGAQVVKVRTLDHFAAEERIERVDLLKIDAEGYDLEVLRGARELLASARVAFVLAEVGWHPGDTRHVLFDDVRAYLAAFGFAVFGIYDQQLEWTGEPRLRYANACFSNERAFTRH
jgi:FkbM family methyltransferase